MDFKNQGTEVKEKDFIDFSKIYSPSRIKAFDDCEKQYYFAYLDPIYKGLKNKLKKMPEYIWDFQTVGKAVHNAITLFYHLPPGERTEQSLKDLLKQTWTSEAQWNKKPPLGKWGGFKTYEDEREKYKEALLMLKNFYKIADTDPDIVFLPTKDFKKSIEDYKQLIFPLNNDFDISGKLDLVIKVNDTLSIIDFKTSKKEVEDNFQLKFYKLLAEKKFGIKVNKMSFYYLRTGKKEDFDFEDVDSKDIEKEISEKIEKIIATTKFEPNPSKLCKYCLFKDFCPAKEEINKLIKDVKEEDIPDDLPF